MKRKIRKKAIINTARYLRKKGIVLTPDQIRKLREAMRRMDLKKTKIPKLPRKPKPYYKPMPMKIPRIPYAKW